MICNRCVMDQSAQEITFNQKGVCNFCIIYDIQEKQRKQDKLHPGLPWTLNEIRKQKGKYDVVIGMSGGVDSSMCLHYLVENGMRVFAFSVDNHWNNNKESDENIFKLVEALKVPFQRIILDKEEFIALQTALFKAGIKNLEMATDHCLKAVSYRIAMENNCKYIISGGNLATESIMPESWGEDPNDLRFINAIFKKFNGKSIQKLPTISLIEYIKCRFIKGIKTINLLDFYEYDREQAIKCLEEKYNYKPYGEKHCESKFTQWFQNFYLPTKWGIDKRRAHYSSLILSGQMKRQQALEELKKPLYYPILGMEDKIDAYPKCFEPYSTYANSQWIRKTLSKIYANIRKQ